MPTNDLNEDIFRKLVEKQGLSYASIGELCDAHRPGSKGFSERSVRRYCTMHGIRKRSGVTNADVDRIVSSFVAKVLS